MPKLPRFDARARKITAALGVMAAATVGGFWLYSSPVFALHGVDVDGNAVISDDVVRQVADLEGRRLLAPDLQAAEARLEAFPLIKEAEVTRDWPLGAHVSIVERQPWGVWQIGDRRYVIDDEAVVLSLPEPEQAPTIFQTDGDGLLEPGDRVDAVAVNVAKQLYATSELSIGEGVQRLEFSEIAGLTAVLEGEVRVQFGGLENYDFKLAALYAVLERAQEKGESVRAVDLRFGDRVAAQ
jgi:cell division septal protein FtsQ